MSVVPTPQHAVSQQNTPQQQRKHICYWMECNQPFPNMMGIQTHLKDLHIELLDKNVTSFKCHWKDCDESGFESKHKLIQHIQEKHFHLSNTLSVNRQDTNNPDATLLNERLASPRSVQLRDVLSYSSKSISQSNEPSNSVKEVIVIEDDDLESNRNSTQNHVSPETSKSQVTETIDKQESNNNCITQETNVPSSSIVDTGGINTTGLSTSNQLIKTLQEHPQSSPSSVINRNKLVPANPLNTVSQPSISRQPFRAVYPSNTTSSQIILPDQSTQATLTDQSVQVLPEHSNHELQIAENSIQQNLSKTESSSSEQSHFNRAFDSLPVDQQNEKLRLLASRQAQEIKKLKLGILLKDKQIEQIEADLVVQTRISKLLQDQNCRADDKLRSMWADMLCKKVHMRDEEYVAMRSAKRHKQEEQTNTNDNNGKQMEIDIWERPSSSSTISVVTQAFVCEWGGCGKVFRTKLALKAHIPSEHLSGTILRVKADRTILNTTDVKV